MTTLISWIGYDSRQQSSIYLASDSRISWGSKTSWDIGKKLYAPKSMPEIFGYCGDVTFPSNALSQICDQIDAGSFFSDTDSFEHKLDKVYLRIRDSFYAYPESQKRAFQVLYVSRIGSGMSSKFFAGLLSSSHKDELTLNILPMPEKSGLIERVGTGRASISEWYYRWQKSDVTGTSRCVFSAFCDSLESREDPLSGGAPQLIGLYRIGQPQVFGLIWNGERFISGSLAPNDIVFNGIEWRNRCFERCDPNTGILLDGAQPQPRPKNVLQKS